MLPHKKRQGQYKTFTDKIYNGFWMPVFFNLKKSSNTCSLSPFGITLICKNVLRYTEKWWVTDTVIPRATLAVWLWTALKQSVLQFSILKCKSWKENSLTWKIGTVVLNTLCLFQCMSSFCWRSEHSGPSQTNRSWGKDRFNVLLIELLCVGPIGTSSRSEALVAILVLRHLSILLCRLRPLNSVIILSGIIC